MTEWDWDAFSYKFWEEFPADDGKEVRKLDEGCLYSWDGEHLVVQPIDRGPMHPNQRLLVETVAQLHPKSVAEFGCGFGDNLYNIGLLLPDAELYGCDISPNQLRHLKERSPSLADRATLEVRDIGVPQDFPQFEVVFTSTVLMHILGDRYIEALKNVFNASSKHVVLMENWETHSYLEWELLGEKLFCFKRFSPELQRDHLLIFSYDPDLSYEWLTDYDKQLRDPLRVALAQGKM